MGLEQFIDIKVVETENVDELHILNIKDIDKDFRDYIDEYIVEICDGNLGTELDIVKHEAFERINKKDQRHVIGAIAEFICTLYMRHLGFKQEFLFFNLEEKSFKKGFDGVYTYDNELFILESKSSLKKEQIKSCSAHKSRLKISKEGLENAIIGQTTKNVWLNAVRHCTIVNSNNDIIKQLQELRESFTKIKMKNRNGILPKIENYNLIPVSTIFYDNGGWGTLDEDSIKGKVKQLFEDFKVKNLKVICVNKSSTKYFLDYLKQK